ncbi:hypothetical protein CBR_g41369 [Chara braunii]|uniref:Uncharacterized protein n=1 Tax=Chara braunii TaxID=69332 RepID=A0A388LVM1_CHABU|nr:hypothetical protein CBR_g41369 [Chara braunii]|eukprot:GBG86374.1 hypothetical protein CBR_g41369 [Chara braunii]
MPDMRSTKRPRVHSLSPTVVITPGVAVVHSPLPPLLSSPARRPYTPVHPLSDFDALFFPVLSPPLQPRRLQFLSCAAQPFPPPLFVGRGGLDSIPLEGCSQSSGAVFGSGGSTLRDGGRRSVEPRVSHSFAASGHGQGGVLDDARRASAGDTHDRNSACRSLVSLFDENDNVCGSGNGPDRCDLGAQNLGAGRSEHWGGSLGQFGSQSTRSAKYSRLFLTTACKERLRLLQSAMKEVSDKSGIMSDVIDQLLHWSLSAIRSEFGDGVASRIERTPPAGSRADVFRLGAGGDDSTADAEDDGEREGEGSGGGNGGSFCGSDDSLLRSGHEFVTFRSLVISPVVGHGTVHWLGELCTLADFSSSCSMQPTLRVPKKFNNPHQCVSESQFMQFTKELLDALTDHYGPGSVTAKEERLKKSDFVALVMSKMYPYGTMKNNKSLVVDADGVTEFHMHEVGHWFLRASQLCRDEGGDFVTLHNDVMMITDHWAGDHSRCVADRELLCSKAGGPSQLPLYTHDNPVYDIIRQTLGRHCSTTVCSYYTEFRHTSTVETFQGTIIIYAKKALHFEKSYKPHWARRLLEYDDCDVSDEVGSSTPPLPRDLFCRGEDTIARDKDDVASSADPDVVGDDDVFIIGDGDGLPGPADVVSDRSCDSLLDADDVELFED